MRYETEKADEAALYTLHAHKTGALIRAGRRAGLRRSRAPARRLPKRSIPMPPSWALCSRSWTTSWM